MKTQTQAVWRRQRGGKTEGTLIAYLHFLNEQGIPVMSYALSIEGHWVFVIPGSELPDECQLPVYIHPLEQD
jgi:hypothetical protein